jgi:SPP1 gp7 family putative phage head morphogenesis protein
VKKLRANRAKPVVLAPIFPNAGVGSWYQSQLDALINWSSGLLLHEIAHAFNNTEPLFDAVSMDAKPNAAGILFRDERGRVLLLRRTDGLGWAFPGGGIEYGEDPEQTARRETFEEVKAIYNGPLDFVRVQEWFGTYFATYTAEVKPFEPKLNAEHDAYVWATIDEALLMRLHSGVRATLVAMVETDIAEDAPPSPTKKLQAALAKWGQQTIKRFDLMSAKIADDFAARNQQATQIAMMAQLKKAGFTVSFKPTYKSIEAYRAVAAENVSLIKSIPRKYHTDVEQKVWNAVRQGSDLNKLSAELRKAHNVTVSRAALIARDQNAKAKATIERVRQMDLGIRRGIWMHSGAGKEPRPTHVAMDGKPYDLAKGMYDSDEGEWVHPGQLINCRCTMRPVIEGFED